MLAAFVAITAVLLLGPLAAHFGTDSRPTDMQHTAHPDGHPLIQPNRHA